MMRPKPKAGRAPARSSRGQNAKCLRRYNLELDLVLMTKNCTIITGSG